ncbi:MAG TPA: hypothetical protein VGN12_22940 [Pirellulales bacterium]
MAWFETASGALVRALVARPFAQPDIKPIANNAAIDNMQFQAIE